MKRTLLKLMALWPWVAGCSTVSRAEKSADEPMQRRFRGVGLVLVVDAVPGAEMEGVVFQDDRGAMIFASSVVARHVRKIMALSSGRVPNKLRAVWRKGSGWDDVRKVWNDGTIIGDYTIPVAERIPDDVLNDIRAHRGALRLKFRLKPDGVLFGWDIQRKAPLGDVSIFEMPGGDFFETRY